MHLAKASRRSWGGGLVSAAADDIWFARMLGNGAEGQEVCLLESCSALPAGPARRPEVSGPT
jgi:hypothetical protein